MRPASESIPRAARRHAPAAERRAQILEAALRCFAERGYHATTMDHVAVASGLSKGSLYWHFDGKEAVFLALFDLLAAEVFGRFDAAAAAAGDVDVVSLLRRELSLFFARFGDERSLLLAWVEFAAHPRGRERLARTHRVTREKLAEIVRLGIARGELRDLCPEGVAVALTGLLDALLLQAAIDPGFDLREHVETLCELVYGGVAHAGGGDA